MDIKFNEYFKLIIFLYISSFKNIYFKNYIYKIRQNRN